MRLGITGTAYAIPKSLLTDLLRVPATASMSASEIAAANLSPASASAQSTPQSFVRAAAAARSAPRPEYPTAPRRAHCQGTLALQDIGCALARTEQAAEIGLGKAAHFHAVADRIDRIRRFDRPALALIVLDDQCEKIETIGVRSARLRFAFEISLDLFERRVIVGLGAKHADYFFRHDTVSGSMRVFGMVADKLHEKTGEREGHVDDQPILLAAERSPDCRPQNRRWSRTGALSRWGLPSAPRPHRPAMRGSDLCPRVTHPKFRQRPPGDHLHADPYHVTNLVTNLGGHYDPVRSSYSVWPEAGVIAGALAGTQGFQKHQRKECLEDALVYLSAAKAGLSVLTATNSTSSSRWRPRVSSFISEHEGKVHCRRNLPGSCLDQDL
jgi:hypothetical protein